MDLIERKSEKNINRPKSKNPSSKPKNTGLNAKNDKLIFENNFMKNIKIDEKKNGISEVNISVSRSNKKDNKLETMESKKENIMKIPKVFQLKYNNLVDKKSQANDLSDKSNTKITTNPSVEDSNEKGNVTNNTELIKSDLNMINKNNEAIIEEKDKDLISRDNNSNYPSTQKTNKLDKQISMIMPVNKFNSILKKKIDIIDNVPVCINNDLEKEDSFRINIVSNNPNEELLNDQNIVISPDKSQLHTFKNTNSNNNLIQGNKGT